MKKIGSFWSGQTSTGHSIRVLLMTCSMLSSMLPLSRGAEASEPFSYTLGGKVRSSNGTPVRGVSVALSGKSSRATLTDSDGRYFFSHLENGVYTVTPGKAGYLFRPVSQQVTVFKADRAGLDFTADAGVYRISGKILEKGTGLRGVTMKLSGVLPRMAMTAASGDYLFSGLPEGRYTVTPTLSGKIFTPVRRDVAVSGGNSYNIDFSVSLNTTSSITGKVVTAALPPPDLPVERQTVRLSGGVARETLTDEFGNFSFTGLPAGTYRVDPPGISHKITNPPWRNVLLQEGEVKTRVDFLRTCAPSQYCEVMGKVSFGRRGLGGVLFRFSGTSYGSGPNEPSGEFQFSLRSGIYTLTPSKAGYLFTPPNRRVRVGGQISKENDFEARIAP